MIHGEVTEYSGIAGDADEEFPTRIFIEMRGSLIAYWKLSLRRASEGEVVRPVRTNKLMHQTVTSPKVIF